MFHVRNHNFDGEQSPNEPELREGNPIQSKQSHFCSQKICVKRKILTGKAICISQDLLFTGLLTILEKGKKMVHPAGFDGEQSPNEPELRDGNIIIDLYKSEIRYRNIARISKN